MKAVEGFKVWQVNDCDWICGTTFAGALGEYLSTTGMSLDEIFDDRDGEINSKAMELSDEDMQRLQFVPDHENTKKLSFAQELKRRVDAGEDTGFFASSEY